MTSRKLQPDRIPDCPVCDEDIFVDSYLGAEDDYICRDCGEKFSAVFTVMDIRSGNSNDDCYHTTLNCRQIRNVSTLRLGMQYRRYVSDDDLCGSCGVGDGSESGDETVLITGSGSRVYHTDQCRFNSDSEMTKETRAVSLSQLDESYRECSFCQSISKTETGTGTGTGTDTTAETTADDNIDDDDRFPETSVLSRQDNHSVTFWMATKDADVFHIEHCSGLKKADNPIPLTYSDLPSTSRICLRCESQIKHGHISIDSLSESESETDSGDGDTDTDRKHVDQHLNTPRDIEDVPEKDPDQVWESLTTQRRSKKSYHTQRSCHQLRKANRIRAVALELLPDGMEECQFCAGTVETHEGDEISTLAWDLRQADSFKEAMSTDD